MWRANPQELKEFTERSRKEGEGLVSVKEMEPGTPVRIAAYVMSSYLAGYVWVQEPEPQMLKGALGIRTWDGRADREVVAVVTEKGVMHVEPDCLCLVPSSFAPTIPPSTPDILPCPPGHLPLDLSKAADALEPYFPGQSGRQWNAAGAVWTVLCHHGWKDRNDIGRALALEAMDGGNAVGAALRSVAKRLGFDLQPHIEKLLNEKKGEGS
jgi:hypothetical protein